MKAKIINFSTQYKVESNSGSYGDYLGLKELGIEFTNGDDYDYIIFSLSNINFFGGLLSDHTINTLKLLKENKKPVICLFLDFKCYTKKIKNRDTYPELENFQFEDYRDNWYLFHYCRKEDSFREYIKRIKDGIKFKEENIYYFNNESIWYYQNLEIKENNGKICYIGNGRGGERNDFLSKFNGLDIYGRWKDKQIEELQQHNFLGILKQTKVKEKLNEYWGHIVTYDKIGLNYEVDSTRLIYTISAGCLPLIDKRLKYLNLPEEFNILFIENQKDVKNLQNTLTESQRLNIIERLRKYFNEKIDKQKELVKIDGILQRHI